MLSFSNISSLRDFNTRKLGLLVSCVFLAVKLILNLKGVDKESLVFMTNLFFLLSLNWVVFSKEKIDDERFRAIRYFSFKTTFQLVPLVAVADYLKHLNISPINFAIGMLMCYLTIYFICVFINPTFIFEERTRRTLGGWGLFLTALVFIFVAAELLLEIFALQ